MTLSHLGSVFSSLTLILIANVHKPLWNVTEFRRIARNFFEGTLFHEMLDKSKISLYALSCSLFPFFQSISLSRVLVICCPLLTGKGHSLELSPGHSISCICCKVEIKIKFCGAKNLSLL